MKEFEITITRHRNGDIDLHDTNYDIKLKAISGVKSSIALANKEGNVLKTVEFINQQNDDTITSKLLTESTHKVCNFIPKDVITIMHTLRRLL